MIVFAAIIAFGASPFDFGGTVVVTGVGAAAIAGAGVLGVLTRRAPGVELPRRAGRIAAAGAALALAPLVVNVAYWRPDYANICSS